MSPQDKTSDSQAGADKASKELAEDVAKPSEEDDIVEDLEFPLWFAELALGGTGEGFLEKGTRHSLLFVRRPVKRLIVTFDNLSNVNNTATTREPWAYKFARDSNVSHLGIMAHAAAWFRDEALIDRMKKLAAEGFFDGYDRVLFTGTSMGAFGAIVFASLVPGAHVVALNPQSTLDVNLVPWEERYEKGRRQDWSLPLGDAAALTENLGPVRIIYDPYYAPDKKHVERFSGDNIQIYNAWFSGHKSGVFLRKIDGLKVVMSRCLFDDFSQKEWYKLYRRRRMLPWYRGSLSGYFKDKGREAMAHTATRVFRENLREIRAEQEASAAVLGPALVSPPPQCNDKRVIVTTMKNEGPFMLEWVAYNRAIGFTNFIIYTNDCDDGTEKIAKRLEEMGLAKHEENKFRKGASPQRMALRRAPEVDAYKEADWLICADCDEFLNIRVGDGTLDALFEKVPDIDAMSVCWKLFGNGGQLTYKQGLIIDQFEWGLGEDEYPNYRAYGMKTLVRQNAKFDRLRVHRPWFNKTMTDIHWVDGGGKPMPATYLEGGWKASEGFTHDYARLHHYAVRSVDSFLVKRDRGRTNHVNDDQGEEYWRNMNYNSTRDTSIKRMVGKTQALFDEMLQDEKLKNLHNAACEWHEGKIATLRERDGWAEFSDKISKINAIPSEALEAAE
ncbi:hypothetical protein RB2150_01189 [Rhodobacteraceae bacterium HTCC2150]|nr:hypothetical protein RB2150_01189 [Rhodobacteraceae bacterium HTCC2150]